MKPPQQPRPSTTPNFYAGQFGDEIQMDVFYSRTLNSTTLIILGMVDRATGLQQASIVDDRSAHTMFHHLENTWLKPYGLPLRIVCDPDTSFKGAFQERVHALGCLLTHCPPEAHHTIGVIERRNALLRLIFERLVDQFGATSPHQCKMILSAACHAINAGIHTHGRSAYQAVFGRQPRLLDTNFNDPMVLATSSPVADLEHDNPMHRAELVRAEAIKALHDLDISRHVRRALLRKTRITKVADLKPGQKCAFWRWSKRGSKKRGSWVIGRFLSWDPSHLGKQAWIRSGHTTVLVTAEQLRAAFGFEDWTPDASDIAALKDASTTFGDHFLDDRGPEPDQQRPVQDDDIFNDIGDEFLPLTPSMMVPATPPVAAAAAAPSTPNITQLKREEVTNLQQTAQQTTNVRIDSPTHITYQHVQQQQYHRYGNMPTTPPSTRRRSRTPTSQRDGRAMQDEFTRAEQPATPRAIAQNTPPAQPEPVSPVQTPVSQPAILAEDPQRDDLQQQQTPMQDEPQDSGRVEEQPSSVRQSQDPIGSEPHQQPRLEDDSLPLLPQKRSFEALPTFFTDDTGHLHRLHQDWDGSPMIGYGPRCDIFHRCYLTTSQREADTKEIGKDPADSDTTQDSETDDDAPSASMTNASTTPSYKEGLSRQEVKALDREIPWRNILQMPAPYVDRFLQSIEKEANSWMTWQSVEPLSDEEANRIMRDPVLSKRVLKSRACYRDKACGIGELRPKCRIVALGHLDPDLKILSRNAATPGRISEQLVYLFITAGYNRELFDAAYAWTAWSGDAATAFLQGVQEERPMPLFLSPPKDGLIALTDTWTSKLYRIRGNVYGLANAPLTWSREVKKRLFALDYCHHSFDKQLYYKRVSGEVVSIVLVYVDDFLGLSRSDYNIKELHQAFEWGSLHPFKTDEAVTFKGKEITLLCQEGRFRLSITMKKFIDGLDRGSLKKGRLQQDEKLSSQEQRELRSVSGCLQWASTQARPEISPSVSLSGHGDQATIKDLRHLYSIIDYLKETSDQGLMIQDIPVGVKSMVMAYSDSSWSNASKSGSQLGILVGLVQEEAKEKPSKMGLIDWRSVRSPRVCRSTLAAEACAADEAADRSYYLNLFLGEFLYDIPAHKVSRRLSSCHAVDARSLFDAVISENPNLADKRTLVAVRSIQDTISSNEIRWCPTTYQWADGLTKVCDKLRQTFRSWLNDPTTILTDKGAEEAFQRICMPTKNYE